MTILALPQQRTGHARRPATPQRRTRPAGPARVAASADLHAEPADVTVDELSATVMSPLARCAGSALDPDEWYPVASRPAGARAEAARALAVCAVCPVRAECLELSMRVWDAGGEHGIWGGLVEADRAAARAGWLAGTPVTVLLKTMTAGHG
ncbi:MAG TPA: WhiB family transcriptional regulator [Streptosporangiaceae bacterium]|nr:WhiB family transcriptional regulator [Streptosporangiaceae bacterium]